MDLKQLNKQYFLRKDMYTSVLEGISSNLISYRNGIMYIEVVISKKWKRSYDYTAFRVAHDWKKSFESLEDAIGCKVFIIDKRNDKTLLPVKKLKLKAHPYQAKKGILFRSDQLN
jgi:hypothetical protein